MKFNTLKTNIELVFLVIFISSCSVKTPSDNEIKYRKQSILDKRNIDSQHTIKKGNILSYNLIKDLEKINLLFYNSKDKVKFVYHDYGAFSALPNNYIGVSNHYINKLNKYFTDEERLSIICHESAHIINKDWTNRVIEENSHYVVKYKSSFDINPTLSLKSIYLLNKKMGLIGDMTYDEFIQKGKYNSYSNYNFDTYYMETKKLKNSHSLGQITDSQGFHINKEYIADRDSVNCMINLGMDPISVYSALLKVYTNEEFKVNKIRMFNRLTKLKLFLKRVKK